MRLGQWRESEESFRRSLKLDPNRSETRYHFAVYVLWPLDRMHEALEELRRAEKADPLSQVVQWCFAYMLPSAGRYDEAEKLAVDATPFTQAVIFAGLGDKERALEAMERSTAAGPFRVGRQLMWPELALIRNDPRMKALRKKVGLPE
jgi:tetratricopeptide (TPR) repeat protein